MTDDSWERGLRFLSTSDARIKQGAAVAHRAAPNKAQFLAVALNQTQKAVMANVAPESLTLPLLAVVAVAETSVQADPSRVL